MITIPLTNDYSCVVADFDLKRFKLVEAQGTRCRSRHVFRWREGKLTWKINRRDGAITYSLATEGVGRCVLQRREGRRQIAVAIFDDRGV